MRGALLLDLEVSHQGNILKLGAVCAEASLARARGHNLAFALDELAALALNAKFVVGHNLLRFDLPVLHAAAARHPLLKLPVIDTLVLSPICFPENPYHRLVNDYKLVHRFIKTFTDSAGDIRLGAWPGNPNFQLWSLPQRKSNALQLWVPRARPRCAKSNGRGFSCSTSGVIIPRLSSEP